MFQQGRDSYRVDAHDLTEPWNVETASGPIHSYDFSDDVPVDEDVYDNDRTHGLHLRHTGGSRMYIGNRREILQYDLSTDWDVSTALFVDSMPVLDYIEFGHDIDISPDGEYLYFDDRAEDTVVQFEFRTPWDITTLEHDYTLDISKTGNAIRGLELSPGGVRMFHCDTDENKVFRWDLTEPWDLSTATFTSEYDFAGITDDPRSVTWRQGGERFYITDRDRGEVLQFDIV